MSTPTQELTFYEDNAGEQRWRLVATNGEIVGASSEGFISEPGARDNAKLVFMGLHQHFVDTNGEDDLMADLAADLVRANSLYRDRFQLGRDLLKRLRAKDPDAADRVEACYTEAASILFQNGMIETEHLEQLKASIGED